MYAVYIVRRTQIYLDEGQDALLSRRARAEGITRSAVIRKAVDAYLAGRTESNLEEFRRAVRAAAGSVPRLDAGYLEDLHEAESMRQAELEKRRRA